MKRAILVLAGLCFFVLGAFGVDEWTYSRWDRRMAAASRQFEAAYSSDRIWSTRALPGGAGLLAKPNISFVVFYEPPLSAWTYHVSQRSRIGYHIVRWYQAAKRRVSRGKLRSSDHAPYVIGVRRCMPYDPCSPKEMWQPYVEHQDATSN